MKTYVVFGDNAVMIEHSYDHAKYCLHKYFRGHRYIKAFPSVKEAVFEATNHLWTIAPLDRIIPDNLKPCKIYAASKLPLNV